MAPSFQVKIQRLLRIHSGGIRFRAILDTVAVSSQLEISFCLAASNLSLYSRDFTFGLLLSVSSHWFPNRLLLLGVLLHSTNG